MRETEPAERSYSYTLRAWRHLEEAMNTEAFLERDTEVIFDALSRNLREVPFRRYLKRYLYEKTEMTGSYAQVTADEYQDIIVRAFQDTGTPCSFTPGTSTRLSQAARNWLTRKDVSRDTVLLMGFGLFMSEEDVNAFLTRALHDTRLDPDDPKEALCLYCYRRGYRFDKYRQLADLYRKMDGTVDRELVERGQPANREQSRLVAREDADLLDRLLQGASPDGLTPQKRRAADAFAALYREEQGVLSSVSAGRNGSPRSVEKLLSASVPPGGETRENLLSITRRKLNRQKTHRILSGEQLPDRYDLLTLHFLLESSRLNGEEDGKAVLRRFIDSSNQLLTDCGFGEIYPVDPFDAFLMLCMLTYDPFVTYFDVMENAWTTAGGKEEEP